MKKTFLTFQITREQFISLHNQPILENLSKYFVKTFCDISALDISASEAGNQSRDSNHSDSLSETDQSNNALPETSQSEDVSYLSKQTNQSNSDTGLERDSGLVNGEELNLSDCDLQNGSKLKHLHSDSRNNDSEFADCDSNDTESMHLDSDSIDLESSQSEDLLNVEHTRSENEPENTAKHKRNEEGSRSSRKLTEHQKNLFLKKVLTSVPERGKTVGEMFDKIYSWFPTMSDTNQAVP